MSVENGLKFFRDDVEEKIRINDAATKKAEHYLAIAGDRLEAARMIRVYDREDLLALVVDEEKDKHIERAQRLIESTQPELDKLALERANLETLLAHVDQAQDDLRDG